MSKFYVTTRNGRRMSTAQCHAIAYAIHKKERAAQEAAIQFAGLWEEFKKSKYKTARGFCNYKNLRWGK